MKSIKIITGIAALSLAFWACKKQNSFVGLNTSKTTTKKITDEEADDQAVCYTSNFCETTKKFSKYKRHHLHRSGVGSNQNRHEIYELEDGIYTKILTVECNLSSIDWASSAIKNNTKYGWRLSDADYAGQAGADSYTQYDFESAGHWTNWMDGSAGTPCYSQVQLEK